MFKADARDEKFNYKDNEQKLGGARELENLLLILKPSKNNSTLNQNQEISFEPSNP